LGCQGFECRDEKFTAHVSASELVETFEGEQGRGRITAIEGEKLFEVFDARFAW
jgi:hypothetical protein